MLLLENNLKESDIWLKQSFASVDQLNNNLSLYIEDFDEIYGYLFNDKLEKISELSAETLPNKYRVYLGNGVHDLQHNIYISNNKKTKFGVYSFDFKSKNVEVTKIDIELKKEKFLQALTYQNTFYIFTVLKDQSLINVYQFSKESYLKKTIDLSHKTFLNNKNEVSTLYNILLKGTSTLPKTSFSGSPSKSPLRINLFTNLSSKEW